MKKKLKSSISPHLKLLEKRYDWTKLFEKGDILKIYIYHSAVRYTSVIYKI